MPYINERGEIMESRPLWRIGTITDFFQGLARMVTLLINSAFQMDSDSSSRSSSSRLGGPSGRRSPGQQPRRRLAGFGNLDSGTMNCSIPGGG
ncbi:selenoprotein K isoform X2 [Rhipicephalus sanguineus]|uniref:selenoprotein K isoform X2 n=1 Tax=Rhipicephalus sanguineus TaxID=34632 RepID=UPI0020C35A05|nr:selenoprotein K isoform X2 [Rhipicephalus sanguineus]